MMNLGIPSSAYKFEASYGAPQYLLLFILPNMIVCDRATLPLQIMFFTAAHGCCTAAHDCGTSTNAFCTATHDCVWQSSNHV